MAAKNSCPGQYQDGHCRRYAECLQARLQFPTFRVAWTAVGIDPFAKLTRHEVLAYKVGKEVWFIDNFSLAPKWVGVEGEDPEVWAMQFYAPAFVIIAKIRIDEN